MGYKKDLSWIYRNEKYIIRNVPLLKLEDEDHLDVSVSLKLTAIRDLMVSKEIASNEVDYEMFDGIEF